MGYNVTITYFDSTTTKFFMLYLGDFSNEIFGRNHDSIKLILIESCI